MSNAAYIALIRHITLGLVLLTLTSKGYTQSNNKAKWYYTVSSNTAMVGDTLELYFRVEIAHNSYIYAINQEPHMAKPTVPHFKLKNCELIGATESLHEVKIFNETYQEEIRLYSGISGGFKQKIKITGNTPTVYTKISFSLCELETGDQEHSIKEFKIPLYNIKKQK